MYVCVYMDACVYECVYASMILLDALRRCYWGFLSVHTCAYACVCVCVCMCACMGACVCVFVGMYVFLCICVHVRLCARACGGGLEVGFVSACSWLALVTGVGGCVLAEVEIGVLSCIFLYFCGC